MKHVPVDIVLPTYNGEKYLESQIQSILDQTHQDWMLIIADDCSSDGTFEIAQKFSQKYPHKIRVLNPTSQNLGVTKNLNYLFSNTEAKYIFLCDQDDIWANQKLSLSLSALQAIEYKVGYPTPLLVHTDLSVVSTNLDAICNSFWKQSRLNPHRNQLKHLLPRNNVTGCTVVMNRALLDLALPIPDDAFMHDWWLALVAAAFGKVVSINNITVLYRQHSCNQVGSRAWTGHYILSRLQQPQRVREYYRKTWKQAQVFLERYRDQLTLANYSIVEAYSSIERSNYWRKRALLFRHGLFDDGVLRNIGLLSLL
jgi:glycosyltransferase involved in cell wall biosynthesis